MKKIRFSLVIASCLYLCLLASCSSFDDTASSKPSNYSNMPATTGIDNLTGFDAESDVLPQRPLNKWTPVTNLNFPTVYFAYDQSRIGTAQIRKLEAVANYMEKHQNLGLIIEGHCDEKGSGEYNIGLGERRALSVHDYLEKLGIPAGRLQTISYGSERPAVSEHHDAAWAKNRRAELIPAKM